jgi:hypothetical protein
MRSQDIAGRLIFDSDTLDKCLSHAARRAREAELARVAHEPAGAGILDQRANALVETAWGDPLDATALGEIKAWRRQLDGTRTILAHGGEQRERIAGGNLVALSPAASVTALSGRSPHIQLVIARVPCALRVIGME